MSLQLRLGDGVHTTKLLSFSEGRMFDMTILGNLSYSTTSPASWHVLITNKRSRHFDRPCNASISAIAAVTAVSDALVATAVPMFVIPGTTIVQPATGMARESITGYHYCCC